jgi:hypothetical protein
MAFRIGRSRAAHTYPQSAGSGGSSLPYGRNNAQGPNANQTLSTSPQTIVWGAIGSGGAPSINVPITPRVTGLIQVSAVIELENTGEGSVNVSVQVAVGGTPIATPTSEVTVNGGSFATIPFQTLIAQTVGETSDIQIVVSATSLSVITLQAGESSLSVHEVSAPTG